MAGARKAVEDFFRPADILIDGARAWDIQVHDERFFARVLSGGTLGFGESYMEGWWDCEALDDLSCRALAKRLEERFTHSPRNIFALAISFVLNRQTQRRSRRVGEVHYDLGNDFFQAMLDPWMQYSCALFQEGDDLAAAQRRKLDLVCRKLELRPGLRLLDIGCGWGGLAKYAAEHYGCSVLGVTISREQQQFAANWCRGFDVCIELSDYRRLRGTFDRAVSVGMVEHVGFKNYRTYLEVAASLLGPGGRFLCQGICNSVSSYQLDPWIRRYIFPNSVLPSLSRLSHAAEGIFAVENVFNLGPHYDPTLMAWEKNFREAWPRFAARYGERFRRMWRFYLLTCAGAFRARSMQVYGVLFSKRPSASPARFSGVPGAAFERTDSMSTRDLHSPRAGLVPS